METGMIIEWIAKSLFLLLAMVTGFAYLTFYERKLLARLQARIGPNRAGPGGWFQPVADGVKLIFKEELIPAKADKLIFLVAPVITVIPALIILGVMPWGGTVNLFGRQVALYVADVNIGALYILSVASISVYGIVLAGWSSNNKYATMGGIRSTAQMISYELALGLAFVSPILLAGSMSLDDMVVAQSKTLWYAIIQPAGAIIFLIATLAEVNRAPFDMPEAEQELTAGYHVEYSGMKFALFFMAEYIKMIAVSAIGATLYFGGYSFPYLDLIPVVGPYLGPFVVLAKVILLLGGMIWVRATLPRIRYDRLMAFGWKVLLPIALIQVLITAVGIVLAESLGQYWLAIVPVVSLIALFLTFYITQKRIGQ